MGEPETSRATSVSEHCSNTGWRDARQATDGTRPERIPAARYYLLGLGAGPAVFAFAFAFFERASFFFAFAFAGLACFFAALARRAAASCRSTRRGVGYVSSLPRRPASLVLFSNTRTASMSLPRVPKSFFTRV